MKYLYIVCAMLLTSIVNADCTTDSYGYKSCSDLSTSSSVDSDDISSSIDSDDISSSVNEDDSEVVETDVNIDTSVEVDTSVDTDVW